MGERWMYKPRTVNVWEVRSKLAHGSKHEKFVKTESAARAFAERRIKKAGGKGRIYATIDWTVYYDEFAGDE